MGNVIIIGNMKAILKFDLPDEAEEHLNAINGTMYKMCLSDIDTWLRRLEKYEEIESIDVSGARDKIRDIISERGLNIEDVF